MIQYNFHSKTVEQNVGQYSLYDLEGPIEQVIQRLQKDSEIFYKSDYVHTITESGYNGYLDGSKKKQVTFDKYSLRVEDDYDDSKVLQVIGTRKFLPEEEEAAKEVAKKEKESKEKRDRETFERIKKEHNW